MNSGEPMKKLKGQCADHDSEMVRLTVSLRPNSYSTLIAIAKRKRVSAAWVIREAADEYLTQNAPLLQKEKINEEPRYKAETARHTET